MRFISWNVNHRSDKGTIAQAKALCERDPDVIALQEVTPKTAKLFQQQFENTKLKYVKNSFPQNGSDKLKGGRQFGELIASRWKLTQIASTKFGIHTRWTQKVLSVVIDAPWGNLELHTVHVPNGSQHGRIKIEMFEAIYKRLAHNERCFRILCGDFNTPQAETAEGRIITWGQHENSAGRFVIGKGRWDGVTEERWDLAERSVLEGLRRYDLDDVFRFVHGYKKKAFSWFTRNDTGRRFDHIFASASLNAVECKYLNRLRSSGLSDHAPIEAVFRPKAFRLA